MHLSRFPFSAMGTDCALHVYTDGHQIATNVAAAEALRIERKYSRYRSDSTVSQLNRVADQGGSVPPPAHETRTLRPPYHL